MEPNNGVVAGGQQGQVQQQQVQQQQPVQQQQVQQPGFGTTPQTQFAPINPQTGQPAIQQTAPAAQQQQSPGELAQLRQEIARGLQIDVNMVPSDMAGMSKIVMGGYAAAQRLQQMGTTQQTTAPAVTQPTQQASTQQPMQLHQMPVGWEQYVTRGQDGQYTPSHPAFSQLAQMANHNAAAQVLRQNSVVNGQFLPEQKQQIDQMQETWKNQVREEIAQESFFEQNGGEIFAMDGNGNYVTEINPQTMQPQKALSPLGTEMRAVAAELERKGVQFKSQTEFAKYTLQIARDRIKNKSAAQPQQTQQQVAQHNDLQSLLASHQQAGANRVTNSQYVAPQFADIRQELRSQLANIDPNANGVQMAQALGLFPQ